MKPFLLLPAVAIAIATIFANLREAIADDSVEAVPTAKKPASAESGESTEPAKEEVADFAESTVFVFGWGEVPVERARTRGGTSQGAPVVLAQPSDLPVPGVAEAKTDYDRDRAAILAMTGDYRVSFHFLETLGLTEDFKPDRPYHSWTTEHIHVLEDSDDFISLQHTLEMHFVDGEGEFSEPVLVKHWRQDWTYEDREILAYLGDSTWEARTVDSAKSEAAWSQAVFHVDDSPRYEVLGRWQHRGNLSVWTSESFLRPLPRREYSVREDYSVLDSRHRLVLTPTGWLHEQQAWKRVLGESEADGEAQGRHGKASAASPAFLAAEIGLNRYERITSPSLTAAHDYWEKAEPYWSIVRRVWSETFADNNRFQLQGKVDGESLYSILFEPADSIAGGNETFAPVAIEAEVREAIATYVIEKP